MHNQNYDVVMSISEYLQEDFNWWLNNITSASRTLHMLLNFFQMLYPPDGAAIAKTNLLDGFGTQKKDNCTLTYLN